jgi:hypothetical protein
MVVSPVCDMKEPQWGLATRIDAVSKDWSHPVLIPQWV